MDSLGLLIFLQMAASLHHMLKGPPPEQRTHSPFTRTPCDDPDFQNEVLSMHRQDKHISSDLRVFERPKPEVCASQDFSKVTGKKEKSRNARSLLGQNGGSRPAAKRCIVFWWLEENIERVSAVMRFALITEPA